MRSITIAVLATALLSATMLIGGAAAQYRDESWERCVDINPDTSIAQCTAAIESGRLGTAVLAGAFSNRGNAFARKGQYDRAIQDFDQAIKLNPNWAVAFNNRCHVRAQFGHAHEGIADCNTAMTLSPRDPHILDSRGYARLRLGQYTEAIQDYDQALDIVPRFAVSLYGRGVAKLKTGDAAGATADFAKAKAVEPDIADLMAELGITP